MVLNFEQKLSGALEEIGEYSYHLFDIVNQDDFFAHLGSKKWSLVELINETYGSSFNLHNWINHVPDEIAYFISEAVSNCLNYSLQKRPARFHLWLGKKSFIIGIEQIGGFNAEWVYSNKVMENEGAGFTFFTDCKSVVFFDDPEDAALVYLQYLL